MHFPLFFFFPNSLFLYPFGDVIKIQKKEQNKTWDFHLHDALSLVHGRRFVPSSSRRLMSRI
ncbi:hypothetical protein L249_6873, partial [Ophiocordyceps polyrhachis-furcata BCC 54312]